MRIGIWFREAALVALVALVIGYAWTFSAVTVPNERTRVYLTIAMFDEKTVQIDGPVARYGRIADLARAKGHYYTDKAPGASVLALPAYAAFQATRADAPNRMAELVNFVRTWLMLPTALLGFVLLRRLMHRLGVSEPIVDLVSLGYALATPAFHYGTVFYGHVLVATLLLLALNLLASAGCLDDRKMDERQHHLRLLAVGAVAGLIGLVEYQATVLAALLALPILLAARSRWRALAVYALGGAPFAAALLFYNTQAFGGPFELSYSHLATKDMQALHGFGLAGATRPTWASISGLLVSQHRGLITTSPLMGLGVLGLVAAHRRLPRGLWLLAVATCVYFVVIVASSSVWSGGWSFGPRLLVPILPLLALAAASLLDGRDARFRGLAVRGLGAAAVLFGFAYHLLLQLTFPEPPPTVLRPLPDVVLPMFEAGWVAPNLACKYGVWGVGSLWPIALTAIVVGVAIAFRGPEATPLRRAARAGSSILLAALAMHALARQPPSNTPAERAGWNKMVGRWADHEISCASRKVKP